MRACGDCSSGKLEKTKSAEEARERVYETARMKERLHKEPGFEENEQCNRPLHVRTADCWPGADESREKWRAG